MRKLLVWAPFFQLLSPHASRCQQIFSSLKCYSTFYTVFAQSFSPEFRSKLIIQFLEDATRTLYRVIQKESAILWEMIVCVILSKKVHMNMGPILNGYRDMVKRRYGPSCEHEQQLRNK